MWSTLVKLRALPYDGSQRLHTNPAAAGPNAIVLSPSSSDLSLRSSGTSGVEELPLWCVRRSLHARCAWQRTQHIGRARRIRTKSMVGSLWVEFERCADARCLGRKPSHDVYSLVGRLVGIRRSSGGSCQRHSDKWGRHEHGRVFGGISIVTSLSRSYGQFCGRVAP